MPIPLRRSVVLSLVIFAAARVLGQQTPGTPSGEAPPTGIIAGQTVDGSTGKAIGNAIVAVGFTSNGPADAVVPPPDSLSRFPLRVVSDDSGHFVFHDLPKGIYTLTANKHGYVDGAFGRRAATDSGVQAIVLGDGDHRGNANIPLWKFATIAGTVVDEAGDPVIGVQLRVFKRVTVAGRPTFTPYGNAPATDDRGVYRVYSLPPGDYIVGYLVTQTSMPASEQASSPVFLGQRVGSWLLQTPSFGQREAAGPPVEGSKVFVYPTVFFPAATSLAKATVISLASGEERDAVDFQMRPVPTARVSGTITGPNGPEARMSLDLIPAGGEGSQPDTDVLAASTTTDATGAYVFLGVPTGTYAIRALKVPPRTIAPSTGTVIQSGTSTIFSGGGPSAPAPMSDLPTLWGGAPVSVDGTDVDGVAITLRTGARITGRLEFDGATQKPAADRLILASVQIDPADGRAPSFNQFVMSRGPVDATGQFKTYQLAPGRYLVRLLGSFPGWTLAGAMFKGRDVSDSPLDLGAEDVTDVVVTLTDRPTELSGTARDSKGVDPTATVFVFPSQTASWANQGSSPRRFRTARVATDGTYRLTGLPVGDYLVVAVRSGISGNWMDSAYLQKLSRVATPVTIANGEKKSVSVESKEIR